jgi:o-succinylbenzoate synthase
MRNARRISAALRGAPELLIETVQLRPYALRLKRTWRAASATLSTRRGVLLGVADADGRTGWGDCAPLPSSGDDGHTRAFAALGEAGRGLNGLTLEAAFARLDIIDCAEARWALETALLDLSTRGRNLSLRRALSHNAADNLSVNAVLGPLDGDCAARAEAALQQGFSIAKLKVGVLDVEDELRRLRELVGRSGGGLRLRLDVNRAWSEGEAQKFLSGVADLPIDGVEEPLANPTVAGLRWLQKLVPFALAVDESLFGIGAERLFAERAVRRLVLKPARIGGFSATLRLAERATAANMDVVVTSVVDSAVGVAAAAQLAAALGGTQTHGLATGAWLAEDVAATLRVEAGQLKLPDGPGLGVVPNSQPAQP